MSKKWVVIIGICLVISSYMVACKIFVEGLDDPPHLKVPKESEQGKVVLTSLGCCFWATDAVVSLVDASGNKTDLISEKTVYEFDVFESDSIPQINAPIQIVIEFTSHYSIEENVSLTVGEFANTDELWESGLLLCFGDGTLNVRNGNKEIRFAGWSFSGEEVSTWYELK